MSFDIHFVGASQKTWLLHKLSYETVDDKVIQDATQKLQIQRPDLVISPEFKELVKSGKLNVDNPQPIRGLFLTELFKLDPALIPKYPSYPSKWTLPHYGVVSIKLIDTPWQLCSWLEQDCFLTSVSEDAQVYIWCFDETSNLSPKFGKLLAEYLAAKKLNGYLLFINTKFPWSKEFEGHEDVRYLEIDTKRQYKEKLEFVIAQILDRIFHQDMKLALDVLDLKPYLQGDTRVFLDDSTDLSTVPGLPQLISRRDDPSESTFAVAGTRNSGAPGAMPRIRYQRFADADCSGSKFTTCVNVVERYRYILKLNLNSNQLKSLDVLLELKYLTELSAISNNITALPSRLNGVWKFLYVLKLANNQLKSINELSDLKSLEHFDVQGNDINDLPLGLADLPNLKVGFLHGNPLRAPFDLLAKPDGSLGSIVQVLKDLKAGGEKWNLVKVVMCGREGVGKTYLTRRLQKQEYTLNQSTDGIGVELIPAMRGKSLKNLQFLVFDMGGQEVFYPTHQFFLTGKALYVIAYDLTDVASGRIEYWLRTIRNYSLSATVILVGTHLDAFKDPNARREAMTAALAKIQPLKKIISPFAIMFVSSVTKEGFEEFRAKMIEAAEQLPVLQSDVPTFYNQIAAQINERKARIPYVHLTEFKTRFAAGITSSDSVNAMLEFLNDVGVVNWFNKAQTREIVVLDCKWLADVMASLVSFKVRWKHGTVTKSDIQHSWKGFQSEEASRFDLNDRLIDLLEQFEILFPYSGSDVSEKAWVVPCMMPAQEPEAFTLASGRFKSAEPSEGFFKIHRQYTFAFMPKGFFSKLVVRLMHLEGVVSKPEAYWLSGLVLRDARDKSSDAESVLVEYQEDKYRLSIIGLLPLYKQANTQEIFSAIIASIEDILSIHYQNQQASNTVEAFCSHCLQNPVNRPGVFPIATIAEAFMDGRESLICPIDSTTEVPIERVGPDICLSHLPTLKSVHINQELARGGYGVVSKGRWNDKDVAVKELLHHSDDSAEARFEQFNSWHHEVLLMSKLQHPNLVTLHGIMLSPLRLVMDFCNAGDLYSYLQRNSEIPWAIRTRLILDIARGVEHLHSLRPPVVHRDLRTPNVFLEKSRSGGSMTARVGDFGLSTYVSSKLSDNLLTWQWLAPEVFDVNESYSESSDAYSFALCAWNIVHPSSLPYEEFEEFMVLKELIFSPAEIAADANIIPHHISKGFTISTRTDGSVLAIMKQFKEGTIRIQIKDKSLRPTFTNQQCPPWLVKLINMCWHKNPAQRPKFSEIVETIETETKTRPLQARQNVWKRPKPSVSNAAAASTTDTTGPQLARAPSMIGNRTASGSGNFVGLQRAQSGSVGATSTPPPVEAETTSTSRGQRQRVRSVARAAPPRMGTELEVPVAASPSGTSPTSHASPRSTSGTSPTSSRAITGTSPTSHASPRLGNSPVSPRQPGAKEMEANQLWQQHVAAKNKGMTSQEFVQVMETLHASRNLPRLNPADCQAFFFILDMPTRSGFVSFEKFCEWYKSKA